MKRYKRKFGENLIDNIELFFQRNIPGYGGSGISDLKDYNKLVTLLVQFMRQNSSEIVSNLEGTTNNYTDRDVAYLHKLISDLNKVRI